ncbi:hypothetical protein [Paenirhodobacter populi]|uniref:hypothetical protein n=1 Tax=Paenirhodobacter populi TaxID=2306993 RepID=UPI0019D48102|nr:hypothetical protein [Sinirhodobacter populi]
MTIQIEAAGSVWKCAAMVGSATLAMVPSSTASASPSMIVIQAKWRRGQPPAFRRSLRQRVPGILVNGYGVFHKGHGGGRNWGRWHFR